MKKKYDHSKYDKAYYKKNRDEIKKRRASLPDDQKQLLKERAKKYYQEHKEYFQLKLAEWRKTHPEYNKNWRAAHPKYAEDWKKNHPTYNKEKHKENYVPHKRQEYEQKTLHPMYKTWERAQKRARKKNIPFLITLDDLFIPDICPYLEIPLTGKGTEDNSPSLDRIIPELGYVPGNVEIISMLANRMKNSANPDQLLLFATNTIKKFSDPK